MGVGRKTLYRWAEAHEGRSAQPSRVDAHPERLEGRIHPTITKPMLSSNHDYREKQETDVTERRQSCDRLQLHQQWRD
jgi:hypothetical protein